MWIFGCEENTSRLLLLVLLSFVQSSQQQTILDGVFKLLSEGEAQLSNEPRDVSDMLPEYDFIVVGAGTAGCAVANRLSENPEWKVLLIEAGRPENYLMDIPLVANYLQFTESNWRYKTAPSGSYCMGMDNSQCNFPRGKVMGGSSVLNYMIYTRGNHRDYDNWAAMGNPGWSYRDVLPYFKKVENFSINEPYNNNYHGKDGHVRVTYSPYMTKIADAIMEAGKHMGVGYVDYNGATQVGMSRLQVTMRDGVRDSSSRAYLHPIKGRSNLHVSKYSMVTRLLIDEESKVAYGVEVVKSRKVYVVKARKEVIVSAGAINSPQLLMLSGIGPKKHLQKIGIKVLSNLKVGYNLMDHIAVGGLTFMIDKPYSIKSNNVISRDNLLQYLNYHLGPFSIPGGCEVLSFHDLKNPNDPDGYPDIELLYQAGSIVSDPLLRRDFGINETIYKSVFGAIEDQDSFMVFPMLLRPKSKGRIMLRDSNYHSKPLIYPNYFSDPEDLRTIVAGVRLALNITMHPTMQQTLGVKLHDTPIPGCAHLVFGTDDYFACMARHFTFTIYHQSGTCKMGPRGDRTSVVDPRLRVIGIRNLRVVDASVIPEIPAAHTNAPTYMIAEKGADMIKEDWGVKGKGS